MNDYVFSVVIPVYNREAILRDTLKSVLNQTLKEFEVLVVDDGSKDNPLSVIESFNDDRIKYIRQENRGGGAARNNGIVNARGKYVAFLDSDDLFLPDKLERYSKEFSSDKKIVLYSSMFVERGVDKRWIRPDRGIGSAEDVGEYLFCGNQLIQTSTIALHADFARQVKFDDNLRRGQDLDFCVRLQAAGARFQFINTPLTVWRDDTEQGRTSYVNGVAASSDWLASHEKMLTPKAVYGYRATVLAYHLAKVKPLTALSDLWAGWRYGDVPARTILRQVLRAYLPRRFYRMAVNSFVAKFGRN